MRTLDRVTSGIGEAVSRRTALRRFAAWFVSAAAFVNIAGTSALAGSGPSLPARGKDGKYHYPFVVQANDASKHRDPCGIYCTPVDCCSPGCCSSGDTLLQCVNNCDGSYFYVCSDGCTGFCYSQLC